MGLDQSCPNLRERGAICRLIKFAELSFSFFIAIQYLNPVSAKISVIPADPLLEQQKQEHDEYSEKLVNFLCDAIAGTIDRDSLEDFLGKWWVGHILESDMQYAGYLQGSV